MIRYEIRFRAAGYRDHYFEETFTLRFKDEEEARKNLEKITIYSQRKDKGRNWINEVFCEWAWIESAPKLYRITEEEIK